MGLLSRFRESAAIRCVRAVLEQGKSPAEGVAAAVRLMEVGTQRCVPILCEALAKEDPALQVQAARALATVQKRQPDERILKALNAAVLNERHNAQARQAAVEAIATVVDASHTKSLHEVLRSHRTPLQVRVAAIRALKKLGYGEVLERLVEATLFGPTEDPRGEIHRWAIRELGALDEHEKLTKIYEIIHGRRKLHYRSFAAVPGGPASLVPILAEIDPKGAIRFLHMMSDDENPGVREAAVKALRPAQGKGPAAAPPPG